MSNVNIILMVISLMIAGVGFILGWISKDIILQKKIINLVRNYSNKTRQQQNEIQKLKYELNLNQTDLDACQNECDRLRVLLHENGIEGGAVLNPRILQQATRVREPGQANNFSAFHKNPGALIQSISI